jgi:hypothetical protein
MKFRLFLLLLLVASAARAQIAVTVSVKERFYLLHEPILATVNVTNRTGRDIVLSDMPENQWFGFRIIGEGDRMVAPRDLHYHLDPLPVKAGETVRRSVTLNQLYEIGEPGNYRIQAVIYYDGLDKYFSSRPTHIDVAEGRVVWGPQVAGVPEGMPNAGQMRVFSLLAHQRGEVNTLYVRVTDKEDGTIFCTFPVGRLLDDIAPQVEFDSSNNLYVLHLAGTRAYVLTKISPNGQFEGQTGYSAPKTRPTMRKTADGALQIIGGKHDAPIAQNPGDVPPPKLSDRPPGFPSN